MRVRPRLPLSVWRGPTRDETQRALYVEFTVVETDGGTVPGDHLRPRGPGVGGFQNTSSDSEIFPRRGGSIKNQSVSAAEAISVIPPPS